MMVKAFVTGGTGFIGTHLIHELIRNNFFVYALIRSEEKAKVRLPQKYVKFLKGNIFEIEKFPKEISESTYFFHLAALTKALKKSDFHRVNVIGTEKVVNAAKKHGKNLKKFVFISSLAAIGPSKGIENNSHIGPISTYGRSKLEAEKIVRDKLKKADYTIIRPPAVFGPYDMDVYKFFKSIKRGILPLIGTDEKYVSIIYAKDLAKGIVNAAISRNTGGKCYCISYDKYFTWGELGKIAAKIMKKKTITIKIPHSIVLLSGFLNGLKSKILRRADILDYDKAKEIIQSYWICDTQKAKNDFNFMTTYTIEKSFEETISWYEKKNLL